MAVILDDEEWGKLVSAHAGLMSAFHSLVEGASRTATEVQDNPTPAIVAALTTFNTATVLAAKAGNVTTEVIEQVNARLKAEVKPNRAQRRASKKHTDRR